MAASDDESAGDERRTGMTADKVDVSQQSGDAFAHGNVKATWTGASAGAAQNAGRQSGRRRTELRAMQGGVTLGGNGPAHVVAS